MLCSRFFDGATLVFTLFFSCVVFKLPQLGETRTDIMTFTPTKIVSFYISLIDEQIEQLGNHLADDVVLYWYGRTVKGKELVLMFLSQEIASPEHNLISVKAIPKIHYREISSTSRLCTTKHKEDACLPVNAEAVGLLNSDCQTLCQEDNHIGQQVHKSGFEPVDSTLIQNTPDVKMSEHQRKALLHKPKKRKLIPCPSLSLPISNGNISFLEARGSVSFHRVGRYGYRRPWHRECTLQLAYSCPPFGGDPVSCCEFSVIIYSDEMKCRRNLSKVFEQMKIEGENFEDEVFSKNLLSPI